MSFTLAGKQIARVTASRPRYGVASAEVELDGAYDLTGSARLVLGDLSMDGIIKRGGVANGVGRYEWLAGKGLWDLRLPPDGNRQSALGVRRSTVIDKIVSDMRRTAGAAERVVNDLPELRLRPGWSRSAGSGREALAALGVPFWVAPNGDTRLGVRSTGEVAADATILEPRPEADATSMMPTGEQIAAWAPGAMLAGRRIGHVTIHTVREQAIKIMLTYAGATDRDYLNEIIRAETSKLRYLGPYTYTVRSRSNDGPGPAYGLTPDREDMPVLDGVEIWGGLAGHSADLKTGSKVVVNFLDGDPARYVIVGFLPSYGNGGKPDETRVDGDIVRVNEGTLPVHRQTDPVRVYGLQFITSQLFPTAFSISGVNKLGLPVGAIELITLGADRVVTLANLEGEATEGAEDFLA